MTQGTPPDGGNSADDNNETVALRRGDLPPGAFGHNDQGAQGGSAPTAAQPAQPQYGQSAQPQYGQPAPSPYGQPAPSPYGQPQQSYGQPPAQPYGQPSQSPSYGTATATPPYHQPAATGRRFGTTGLILALIGAVAAAVGLFAVRWTKIPNGGSTLDAEAKFLDLRRVFVAAGDLDLPNKPTFTIAYFQWAAFVLIGVALVFAVLSALPTSATPAFRVLGFVVGLVSAAAAAFVPALDDGGLSEYLKGGLGLYLVAGGSLIIAVAALIGSKKQA